MTDLELAKQMLTAHTIVLCKNGLVITSDEKGISPMINFLADGEQFNGFSVADLIVGKAVAMLFVKAGIKEVFAKTISKSGAAYLDKFNIPYTYEIMTDNIINRKGDDICPMEKAVLTVEDFEDGYNLIKDKLSELKLTNTL